MVHFMKNILLFVLLLWTFPALASYQPPCGTNGQLQYNNNGACGAETSVTSAQAIVTTTTAFAGTVTPVGSNPFNIFIFGTQTGNVTIAAPSGSPVNGNQLEIRFVIDGTGSYTTTFNAIYAFGTDITAALVPTAANSKFMMKFIYVAADSKWRAVAIARGF